MDRAAALCLLASLAGFPPRTPSLLRGGADCDLVTSGYGPAGAVPIRVETVATGLEVPWGIAFLPGGDWLITERPGRVRLLRSGRLLPDPVMTVDVMTRGEGGLLGIAAHPRFSDNHLFYVYATVQTKGGPVNRVIRYRLAGDRRSAVEDRVILDGIAAAPYHDGGRIRFGPDGMLYVTTGDGGVPARSESRESLNGKLLRITPEGAAPADNPSPGSPVFLLGLRNPQGFDWLDRRTLIVADHGPSGEFGLTGYDEVNVARAGDDLGWPLFYGCRTARGKIAPALSWATAVPPGGAALYTGRAIPEWRGSLLIGTLRSKHLHRVVFDPGSPGHVTRHEVYLQGDPPGGFGRLRDVVMGPDACPPLPPPQPPSPSKASPSSNTQASPRPSPRASPCPTSSPTKASSPTPGPTPTPPGKRASPRTAPKAPCSPSSARSAESPRTGSLAP